MLFEKRWRHPNRHDRAPAHSTVSIQNGEQTVPCGFSLDDRCSVDGWKRYEKDKCGRKSLWERSKTALFSFENGLAVVYRAKMPCPFIANCSFPIYATERGVTLTWLIAVSSTNLELDFDVSLLPLVLNWCCNHGIKALPNHWWTWHHFCDTMSYHSNTMTFLKHP